jgi:hypothetical protein
MKRLGSTVVAVGLSVTAAGVPAVLAPTVSHASSHREAPAIAGTPRVDGTDLYAFVSPDDATKVTLIANYYPNQEPAGGPNFFRFDQDALYDINIDNNGDSVPDVIYRWDFTDHTRSGETFLYNTGQVKNLTEPTLNFYQTYNLELRRRRADGSYSRTVIVHNAQAAPSYVGNASMPDYAALRTQATKTIPNGRGRVFAGQADDPFFLDLRVFDLLYGTDLSEVGNDTLKGKNVNVLALQVPKEALAAGADATKNPIVGVTTTSWKRRVDVTSNDGARRTTGAYTQVSRLGNPLVNEVVIPVGKKDRFNGSRPFFDSQFGKYVTNPELPKLMEAVYKIKAPAEPRNDLVQVFLTGVPGLNMPTNVRASEQLRLNMSIAPAASPQRLGVIAGDTQGYPNGRRLTDDVVDIALQVVEGELVGSPNDLGDGVNANDKTIGTSFPYVALPHSGSAIPPASSSASVKLSSSTSPASDQRSNGALLSMAGLVLAGAGLLVRRRGARGARG